MSQDLGTPSFWQRGHSDWPTAVLGALVLGLGALAAFGARHFAAGAIGEMPRRPAFLPLALRLSGMQLAAFLVIEITERLWSGAPLEEMLRHHLFLIGLAIQLLVGAAAALLLLWLGRAAEAVGRFLRHRSPHHRVRSTRFSRPEPDGSPSTFAREASWPRAPPSPSFATV